MESATKNRQSEETIQVMTQKAFPGRKAAEITELTEGFFNVAYQIRLSDGAEVILKIAPPAGSLIMTHEKNIMSAEVECMRMVRRKTTIPAAEILFYDSSRTLCSSDYFFMTKLEGKSLHSVSEKLPEEEKERIQFALGQWNAELNRITNSVFGYFSQPDRQGSDWFQVFSSLICDAVGDAKALNIDIGIPYELAGTLLPRDQASFQEVIVPKLVHWDLWEGNVFVKGGKITGLIDFERCLWADELMEVGFRSHNQNRSFLKGYGMEELTESQQIRVRWYDLYLFLICSLECDYREYPDRSQLLWSQEKIRETIRQIQGCR